MRNAFLFVLSLGLGFPLVAAELVVDGYRGAETLRNFPLPVRLSAETFPELATAAGVRFTNEKGVELESEVETWNPSGTSLVWVCVSELKKGTRLVVEPASAPRPTGSVWRNYAGVWHFAETSGRARDAAAGRDAVPCGGVATNKMVSVRGPSGRARVLSGAEASHFRVDGSESMKLGSRFTFSGWLRGDRLNPYKLVRVVSRSNDKGGYGAQGGWTVGIQNAETVQACAPSNRLAAAAVDFTDGLWHHLAVVYDGTEGRIFVDGVRRAPKGGSFTVSAEDDGAPLTFGWRAAPPSNPVTFRGEVDEFRLLKTAASADWLQAEYDALTDPQFLIVKGAVRKEVKPCRSGEVGNRDGLPVIPRVTSWKPTGETVKVGRMVKGDGAEAESVAKLLMKDISSFQRGEDAASTGEIRLFVDPKVSANPEGYRLVVSPSGVSIVGATRQGLFWGTRTLLQLLDAAPDKRTLACGTVDDAPKYRRRGFMLDVARKYFPLSYLRDMAKVMAYYKMNDFHLHLNDNGMDNSEDDWKDVYAAFRLECETYPGLTAKDGSYAKKDFRAFIKECAAIGVQVVPEFDAPAHSLAFTRYRPDFAKKDHDPAHIELKHPNVIPFFEKLWAEYLGGDDPVFAGPVVHVGSDEYWAKEAELFRAFLDRMLGVVQGYGKTPRAWGSLSHCPGKTPVRSKGVELDIWYNPYYGPSAAIRAGYDIIGIPDSCLYICPACGYYCDHLDLKTVYRFWEPCYIGNDEVPPDSPKLLGGSFAVWNDHIGNGISCDDVTDRVFPALQTMSEKLWHGTDRILAYEAFAKIADRTAEAPGVNLRDRVKVRSDGQVDIASASAVGWSQQGGWTASFDLAVDGKEPKDTVLFDDGKTQVCLNLGGSGRFGFRRDGYDCLFKDPLPVGTLAVKMTGDAKGTSLYLDGKLVERLQKPMRVLPRKGKKAFKIAQVETLHFPLKPGASSGKVSNLSVMLGVK